VRFLSFMRSRIASKLNRLARGAFCDIVLVQERLEFEPRAPGFTSRSSRVTFELRSGPPRTKTLISAKIVPDALVSPRVFS
jgi:hypothetical protein